MRFKLWIIYGLVLVMFSATVVKMATVMVDQNVASVGNSQGRKTITVSSSRGTIYDRNLVPLVNNDTETRVALLPQYELISSLKSYMDIDSYRALLDKASTGMPISTSIGTATIHREGILAFESPVRYGNVISSPHLLGYIDGSSGRGVSGLERFYDDLLAQFSGKIDVTFITDGLGIPLEKNVPIINNTTNNSVGGVVTTLDSELQKLVDSVAQQYIPKGAIIIMDAQHGDILAMGSYPAFHPNQLDESLDDKNNPFINRAISLYDCGSIFKIVTAIAALESGVPVERCYECSGEFMVSETVFHCHNRSGHGLQNMEMAFANSCNTYFIQLAQEIGSKIMLDMMRRLGLEQSTTLTEGWDTPSAILPNEQDLSADAALANLSFGQGDLMLTPLQAALLAGVAASGGNLLSPEVVLGYVDVNKTFVEKERRGGETVISSRTVNLLRDMMKRVVTDGTGIRAQGNVVNAAGKTGTAETGQRNSAGYPVVQSWFTGYFPADNPRYVITVFAEDAQNTDADTAKAVCEISNNLYKLKGNGD